MILEIIRTHCIPKQNCLLNVTNTEGEMAFLYFKDAQLIEVNYGSIWGQEAFNIILHWQIANHSVNELPTGIKRTIWASIEKMIESAQTAATASSSPVGVVAIPNIPGFLALYAEEANQPKLISSHIQPPPPVDWLEEFKQKCQTLANTLAAGPLQEAHISTSNFQTWHLHSPAEGKDLTVFAQTTADNFESSLRNAL